MRREIPVLAEIYPAGKETCEDCKATNLAGESFYRSYHFFGESGYLCPECYKKQHDIKKEKQKQLYKEAEEEPTNTDEITCPWCGNEQYDSSEAPDFCNDCECDSCEKTFSYEREIEVTYSSYRTEGGE